MRWFHWRSRAEHGHPAFLITPDSVPIRLGALDFKDGAPSKATLEKAHDNPTSRTLRAFMDNMRGVSIHAAQRMMSLGRRTTGIIF